MVVALGAGHGQRQETAAGRVYTVVLEFGAIGVKRQPGLILLSVLVRQQVARDLGFHEHVVRHVFVEGADYPVAIAERIGERLILSGVELIVGVARYIEPIAPPALAVV